MRQSLPVCAVPKRQRRLRPVTFYRIIAAMEAHIVSKAVNAVIWNIRFAFSAIDGCGTCIKIKWGTWNHSSRAASSIDREVLDLTGYH